MANADKAAVVAKLAAAPYADDFRRLFGADAFADVEGAYQRLSLAVQQYEREDVEFNAYSSKYDAFLRGQVTLSDPELRGLALFNAPTKGNCAACHPSARADGAPPLFTDFTYDNLGVPRNPEIARNADPSYFDLGLCQRADLVQRGDLCGAFKVPSLRNVALREAYFHNGRFKTLKDALTFYVQRDTDPEKWYPLASDGTVRKFDDLPAAYRGNVNTEEAPYNRRPGEAPALSDAEIDDVIAFLETLSDGYGASARQRCHFPFSLLLSTKDCDMTTPRPRAAAAAACIGAALALSAVPPRRQAASEGDLARRVDQLAAELADVKAELARLQRERAGAAANPAANATAASAASPSAAAMAPTAPTAPTAAVAPVAAAAAQGSGLSAEPATVLTSYGELNYNRPVHDSKNTVADLRRFVLGYQHRFDETTKVVTELEVEHAVSSADDKGEVEVEQAYIERQLDVALGGARRLVPDAGRPAQREPRADRLLRRRAQLRRDGDHPEHLARRRRAVRRRVRQRRDHAVRRDHRLRPQQVGREFERGRRVAARLDPPGAFAREAHATCRCSAP